MDILNHRGASLNEPQNTKYEYDIVKPHEKFRETAIKAAECASRIGKKEKYLLSEEVESIDNKKKNPYSYLSALPAIYKKGNKFSKKAKEGVFKDLCDLRNNLNYASNEKDKPVSFNCSYFVSHVLQKAKTMELDNEIPLMGENDTKKEWAHRMRKRYGALLEAKLEGYAINPKAMLPFELYHHLVSNEMYYLAEQIVPHQDN